MDESGGRQSLQRNKELVLRMRAELLSSRDLDRLDDFFRPDVVSHNLPPGWPRGLEGVRRFFGEWAEGFPDADVTVGPLVAEGDLVAVHSVTRGTHGGTFLGVAPTGRRVEVVGLDIVRIANGRIVEHWGLTDTVGLMRQLTGERSGE